jgi:hypothetical protein
MMEKFSELYEAKNLTSRIDVLKAMINKKVVRVYKCSIDTYEEFESIGLYNIDREDFFQFASGAVLFKLESGDIIGFINDESKNSILVWLEQKNHELINPDYNIFEDEEYFVIPSNDRSYTNGRIKNLEGKKIFDIQVLKKEPESAKHEGLPNEVGLLIIFENGEELVLAHNLHPSPDSFSLVFKDQIKWQHHPVRYLPI